MKKILLLFSTVLVAYRLTAQTVDSLPHHNMGPCSAQINAFMEMRDGSLFSDIGIFSLSDEILGRVLHKVSRRELPMCVTDTLFLPSGWMPWSLSARDPQGDGNILAAFYNDTSNLECSLEIRRFDDNLNFDTAEIKVPIAQSIRTGTYPGPQLDTNGDIVLAYSNPETSPLEITFARIGLDGNIKFQKTTNTVQIKQGFMVGPLVFSESPKTYICWGYYYDPIHYTDRVNCYLLDSVFEVTNTYILPHGSGSPEHLIYSNSGLHISILGLDDGNFLVAESYSRDIYVNPFIEDDGVIVRKYDRDFNLLDSRKFLSEPYLSYDRYGATPIGLEKSRDGYIYFTYFTHSQVSPNQVSVVKMDSDLNIVWQRHCLDREPLRFNLGKMTVLDDNSVAVTGVRHYCFYNNGTYQVDRAEVYYVVVHDDYDAVEEGGMSIRPYYFWPNPARSELRLQFSPDVQPIRIELYDLQGRLVCSSDKGLEVLDIQGLASGQYVMKVTLDDGKVFTDKVVKE